MKLARGSGNPKPSDSQIEAVCLIPGHRVSAKTKGKSLPGSRLGLSLSRGLVGDKQSSNGDDAQYQSGKHHHIRQAE